MVAHLKWNEKYCVHIIRTLVDKLPALYNNAEHLNINFKDGAAGE